MHEGGARGAGRAIETVTGDLKASPSARRNLSSTTIFPECHTGLTVFVIHRWTASTTVVLF